MTTTVMAMYRDVGTAHTAVYDLVQNGVHRASAHLIGGPQSEETFATLAGLGIAKNEIGYYVEGLRRGGTLVAAVAEDDDADKVLAILDKHHPIDIDNQIERWRAENWTGAEEIEIPAADRQGERLDAYQSARSIMGRPPVAEDRRESWEVDSDSSQSHAVAPAPVEGLSAYTHTDYTPEAVPAAGPGKRSGA